TSDFQIQITSSARSLTERFTASASDPPCAIDRVAIYQWYLTGERDMERAKIFWSGRSQAVRLPKEFRFEGDEVRIRRHGSAVILEPVSEDWGWLDALVGKLDQDFVEAVGEQPEQQQRPALDRLFK